MRIRRYTGITSRRRDVALRLLLTLTALTGAAACMAAGDAARGEKIYVSCSDCHSLDENEMGPKHRNVVGRKAGAVPDFGYSDALKKSGLTWNEQTLERWLANPQALVPGAKMFFSLRDAQDRADVIAYLKKNSDEHKP